MPIAVRRRDLPIVKGANEWDPTDATRMVVVREGVEDGGAE